MSKVKTEIEVSKETLDVGEFFAELIKTAKKVKGKDREARGAAFADFMPALIDKLPNALEGIEAVDDEYKADPMASVMAIVVPISKALK